MRIVNKDIIHNTVAFHALVQGVIGGWSQEQVSENMLMALVGYVEALTLMPKIQQDRFSKKAESFVLSTNVGSS